MPISLGPSDERRADVNLTLLVANRGEIAIRILRAAAELGLVTCAVHSEDDSESLHVARADMTYPLAGTGPAAYLDGEQLLKVAAEAGAMLLHPGYGFLSENAAFARRCREAGITFVGPSPDVLELFGDKAATRRLAAKHGVRVPAGTEGPTSLSEARAFFESLGEGGAVMVKAVAGGGGRGMRAVYESSELDEAFARSTSEAAAAFGRGDVYVEELLRRVRHVEVQVVGDRTGAVVHLWDRECSLQRRHQKLVEIAPAAWLPPEVRDEMLSAATRLGAAVGYESLGTFEFLVDADGGADSPFVFIEANPRLQVEHTVTEEVTGVDLVVAQLRIALGATLPELGLAPGEVPTPRGMAVQARVNMETTASDGTIRPSSGSLRVFEPPTGPGVRTDTFGYAGYRANPRFDPLLAKVITHTHADDLAAATQKADRALAEFRIEGVDVNIPFLRALLRRPEVAAGSITTRFVDEHAAELADAAGGFGGEQSPAVKSIARDTRAADGSEGSVAVEAPLQGTVISIAVVPGDAVHEGTVVAVLEAMKMEHTVLAGAAGFVRNIAVAVGDTVLEGEPLLYVEEAEVDAGAAAEATEIDLGEVRADLAEVLRRQALTQDEARPDAVTRRHAREQRTARENIADLCDPGSFVEYGSLVIAAQRRRRGMDELIQRTPADGLVTGIGRVNGNLFPDHRARCAVLAYDYMVLAGTQGHANHNKKDRMFEIIERLRLPVVFFTEGGGGRPGDTDAPGVSGVDVMAFALYARLSGLVPTVGVVSGRCFAGNAALLGCSDVIIATKNSTIGMGGPAMIEGGGLGVYSPEEVGPMSVMVANGVVDIAVDDEAEAVRVAKRYLSYFQGAVADWDCTDQRLLRHLVPENRRRVYDVRKVIDTLADTGSVLELRPNWGVGMITALARIDGRPIGIIANNPMHLGGAIDSPGADKAARFMQLCDAFDVAVLFLCDTPGFMVGPEAEKSAQVRHFSRMFVTGASLTVPFFTIVLRKSYGLGAQAMAGGSSHAGLFFVAWPTGEVGGMGLEGAVRLGSRRELEAIEDPEERQAMFEKMVARAYRHGKVLNAATYFEIDDVIDPADSRDRIVNTLRAAPPTQAREGKKRPIVDTW